MVHDSEVLSEVTEWIPTGFIGLDEIFGGGWPVGRASEVFGPEGCGKSALSHAAILQCQKLGGTACYIDFEMSLDPPLIESYGIDPSRLVHCPADYAEQAWDVLFGWLDTAIEFPPDAPLLIVWDSVGATLTKTDFEEKSTEDTHVASLARAMAGPIKRMFKKVARARAHVMLINQERTKFGGMPSFMGPQYETTGGRSLKYAYSIRVRCRRAATLKSDGTSGPAVGYAIEVNTVKNRCAPPHQKTSWVLDFGQGPSPELTLWETLKRANRIKAVPKTKGTYRGSWSSTTFKKREGWFEALQDPVFRGEAEAAYLAVVQAGGPRVALGLAEGAEVD